MFIAYIDEPVYPLTREYLSRYKHPAQNFDYTMECLMLALFKPRLDKYYGFGGDAGFFDLTKFRQLEEWKATKDPIPAFFVYRLYDNMSTEGIAMRVKEIVGNLQEVSSLETYIRSEYGIGTKVLIREDVCFAFVLMEQMDRAVYHTICASIAILYPSMFKDKPLTQAEQDTILSMQRKTKDPFVRRLGELLSFETPEVLRSQLAGCMKEFRTQKINAAYNSMIAQQAKCDSLLKSYGDAVKLCEVLTVEYEGMKALNDADSTKEEDELLEYLTDNPRLHEVRFDNGVLSFYANMPLVNYDVNKYEHAITRYDIYNGYAVKRDSLFESFENRKLLLDYMFSTNNADLNIKFWGYFKLYVNSNTVKVDTPATIPFELENCLENPHYKYHKCTGAAVYPIVQCLANKDFVAAIECAVAAVGNVNINETEITFRPMLGELFNTDRPVILRRDGKSLTPEEALLWIKEKNKNENLKAG